MAHLNENALEKYHNFETMHPVEWVSKMTPIDVVVLKHIIKNSCLGGNTNLHGQRLVYPIKKHSHIRHLYKHLDKSKEHLMEAMMHHGKGKFTGALKAIVKGVKTGIKGTVKAAKVTWKALQKGSKAAWKFGMKGVEFYGKHRSTIDKTLKYGSTALDIGAQIGSAAGLWDPETAARLEKLASGAHSFATRDEPKKEPDKKTGKGQLHGFVHT